MNITIQTFDGKRELLRVLDGTPVEYTEAEARQQIECFNKTASFSIHAQPKTFNGL